MHLVAKSNLKNYRELYPNNYSEATLFEAFVNFVVLRKFSSDNVEPADLIFEGDDPGVDGVLFVVDDVLVSTVDELNDVMGAGRREKDVSIIFTQAKTSEAWAKHEINTFNVAINDFIGNAVFPMSERLTEAREIFFKLFDHVGAIKGGRPSLYAYFATTAAASNCRGI